MTAHTASAMPSTAQFASSRAADPLLLADRAAQLRTWLSDIPSAIIAFSGGVDSSLVAFIAHQVLGRRALAITSASASLTRADLELTQSLTAAWGMAHRVIETNELSHPRYRANPTNRCYYCKSTLYTALSEIARAEQYAVILNGTNLDDFADHRPGLQAATEHAVRAPLAECGFDKVAIRALAAQLGLQTADKPQAACLSSRVPYGLSITPAVLAQIERAEGFLKALGFEQVRVRHHDDMARIEVPPQDFQRALEHAAAIERSLKEYGYRFVALDLGGFRSGSFNKK